MSAFNEQPGGTHYKQMAIQPVQYIHANGLGYCEANIVKYVSRWRDKNGLEDLLKAKHYIDLLIELEGLDRPIPPVGTPVEWPEDESRIDVIGQNGNDAAIYEAQDECEHLFNVGRHADKSLFRYCARCGQEVEGHE